MKSHENQHRNHRRVRPSHGDIHVNNSNNRNGRRVGLGIGGAALTVALIGGLETTGSDVPGQYLVAQIQSGQTEVTATPHTVFLRAGAELLTTPLAAVDSSTPSNLDEVISKGNVAVLTGVGKVDINNITWLVGTHNNRTVFADATDLEHEEATGEIPFSEYAPESFDYDEQAVVRDGQLFQPSNNVPLGAVSIIPMGDVNHFIDTRHLKPVS